MNGVSQGAYLDLGMAALAADPGGGSGGAETEGTRPDSAVQIW